MDLQGTREATHAAPGDRGWYTANPKVLAEQLQKNLDAVPEEIDGQKLPLKGAKVIIAPHAGYSYSGPCAAWAYKALDLTGVKRVFVLGPSHTYYLAGPAVTTFSKYATPFGDLVVDAETTRQIQGNKGVNQIPRDNDEEEHSLEMHLPYIYKRMEETFGPDSTRYPTIVPLLVGDGQKAEEKETGKLLAPYLADTDTAFVVSSDFCHWGRRFSYTKYSPDGSASSLQNLSSQPRAGGKPIHETIKVVDQLAMDAIETGSHDAFVDNLKHTKNTVCGRHPIAVIMAAMEELAKSGTEEGKLKFKFVRYERSNLVQGISDSSVSYAAAYAII